MNNLVFAESLPKKVFHSRYNKLQNILDEFMAQKGKYAKWEYDPNDYKKNMYAYKSMGAAVRISRYTNIKVHKIGDEVWLEKI